MRNSRRADTPATARMMHRFLAAALLLLGAAGSLLGEEPAARTDKALFDQACREATTELCTRSGLTSSSSVLVRFGGGEKTEFFRAQMMDALTSVCRAVYTSGTAPDTSVSLSVADAAVDYGPAFREGLFRERRTARTVSIDLRIETVSASTGRVLHAETLRRSVRDTIAVDDADEAGASTRHIAVGQAPGPSFWERILEPAILTVSSGIAVYLFFTVRS